MTLEKSVPSLGFTENNFIANSPSQKTKYYTLPHSQKYLESPANSKLLKDELNVKGHRTLNRTASDNTFLTRQPGSGFSSTASSTADNAEFPKEKRTSFKKRHESTNDASISRNHSRIVRNFSARELSSLDSKKSSLLCGTKLSERGSRSTLAPSSISHRARRVGEILLDFPCSDDRSSVSSTGKRSEKIKDSTLHRTHRGIQHSLSMPGLSDDCVNESRSTVTDNKNIDQKTRPFFSLFRKKKASGDRSPSPNAKSNSLINRRRSSNPCPPPLPILITERSPSPSIRERRTSAHSMASSKLNQSSIPSTIPCTPSSYMSVTSPNVSTSNSPTSTDKLPYYMAKSRSNRRKEARSNTLTPEQFPQIDDGLTFEDLPVHPSIYKKSPEKTNSYPNTPVLRQKNNRINSNKINNRINTSTENRRNSMPESSLQENDTSESSEVDCHKKNEQEDSSRILRQKSSQNSDKTSSEESLRCERTTSNKTPKKSMPVRSQSVPSFDADSYIPDTDIRVISDAEDFEYIPTDLTGPISLSLCGCGFLGMYHLGVVSCLTQRAPSFLERVEKVGGASGGAIMAAVLVTASDKIEESAEHIQNLAKEIRKKPLGPLTPGYNFTRSLRYMLDDILPQDAHETAQGKLFVSVTNSDTKKNEMLTDFKSRDELIEALVASCYIPVYAGIKIPTIRGKKYIDGGISDNVPKFETGRTITVSPFDGKSDIGPKVGQEAEKKAHFINVQNQDVQVSVNNIKKGVYAFFPPKRQTLQEYFEKGRYDANRFLIREGLYEISTTSQKKAVLYESSV